MKLKAIAMTIILLAVVVGIYLGGQSPLPVSSSFPIRPAKSPAAANAAGRTEMQLRR
jgi:hypothetical protein